MSLINTIGSQVLKNDTGRVCAPPGKLRPNGQRGILVATPTRSGTHLVMDLILNHIPAFRRAPLYIALDSFPLKAWAGMAQSGYVMKTHYPANRNIERSRAKLQSLVENSVVVTVRRPTDDIRASLQRWVAAETDIAGLQKQLENLDTEIDEFWAYWSKFNPIEIAFSDLFQADRCRAFLDELAAQTGTTVKPGRGGLEPVTDKRKIYANKALTRLIGHRAPRIDTTIRAKR